MANSPREGVERERERAKERAGKIKIRSDGGAAWSKLLSSHSPKESPWPGLILPLRACRWAVSGHPCVAGPLGSS